MSRAMGHAHILNTSCRCVREQYSGEIVQQPDGRRQFAPVRYLIALRDKVNKPGPKFLRDITSVILAQVGEKRPTLIAVHLSWSLLCYQKLGLDFEYCIFKKGAFNIRLYQCQQHLRQVQPCLTKATPLILHSGTPQWAALKRLQDSRRCW